MFGPLVAAFLSGETMNIAGRAKRAALAYIVAGLLGLVACGFVVAAAYIWVARRFGAIEACLGFAGGFLLVAVIVLLVHKITSGRRARVAAARRSTDLTSLGVTAAIAALPLLAKNKGSLGMLIAPLAGLAALAIYKENRRPAALRQPPDPLA